MALWGLIVAVALILGSLPLFIGLAVVMPVLGHATWRLYRRAIARDPAREVPIEVGKSLDVTRNPALQFIWIFLDALEFLRRGRESEDPRSPARVTVFLRVSRKGVGRPRPNPLTCQFGFREVASAAEVPLLPLRGS